MNKIGILDSGFGGLTVLSRVFRLLPGEDYIYYGDSVHAPYGTKSTEDLVRLNSSVIDSILISNDIKCFVIACNTTSSAAIDIIREHYPHIPFIGIEPALEPAVNDGKQNILVLATDATIKGKRLRENADRLGNKANITLLSAQDIVHFVEDGLRDEAGLNAYLRELLAPYKTDTDAVVLGCTHFPFVKHNMEVIFSKAVSFYDGAVITANNTLKMLSNMNLLKLGTKGSIEFLNSDITKAAKERELFALYEKELNNEY